MEQTKEIKALFTLIDDPDEEIYSSISEKIVAYGKGIIPNLEHLWETTLSEDVQQRIEGIIQRLHFTDLLQDFTNWKNTKPYDLLSGALLLGKLEYPDMNTTTALQDLEKIRNFALNNVEILDFETKKSIDKFLLYNFLFLANIPTTFSPTNFFAQEIYSTLGFGIFTALFFVFIISDKSDLSISLLEHFGHAMF